MTQSITANFNALSGPSYAISFLPQDIFRQSRSCAERTCSMLPRILSVTEVSISVARRVTGVVWKTLYGDTRLNPADLPLGHVTSGIGFVLGAFVTVPTGVMELNTSYQNQDGEGTRRSIAKVALGLLVSAGSALSLATLVDASVAPFSSPFFFVAVGLSIMLSSLTLYRCATFLSKIDSSLGEGKEDYKAALQFLKGKIAPTAEEKAKIETECSEWADSELDRILEEKLKYFQSQFGDTTVTKEEIAALNTAYTELEWGSISAKKEKKIEERLKALTDVKTQYLTRRTSPAAVKKLVEGIRLGLDAKTLVSAFKVEVQMKISDTGFSLLISSIVLTALILGTFFSMGTIPTALFLVTSGCSLLKLIYPIIEEMFVSSPQPLDIVGGTSQADEQVSAASISRGPGNDNTL
jgi:hypothetical protein